VGGGFAEVDGGHGRRVDLVARGCLGSVRTAVRTAIRTRIS
jgi:hypothetical protein